MSFGENVADTPQPLLLRWLHRARPREGFAVLLLAWVAVYLVPLAVQNGELLDGIGPAQWLVTVALVLAWVLAHTAMRGWLAALVLVLAGLFGTLYWGIYVIRIAPLTREVGEWLGWVFGERSAARPEMTYWADQAELLASFAARTRVWLEGLLTGQGGLDNLVVLFFAGLLAWGIAAWAGWWIARHGQAFVALLPAGALLVQHAYWAPATVWAVVVFIAAATMLIVLSRFSWNVRSWEQSGVDYAEDIRFDVVATGLLLALLVFGLAPTIPSIASGELSRRFWQMFESPYRDLEAQVGRSFEVVRPARSLVPPSGAAEGGLPRAHLLGGAPELGERTALRVAVQGATAGLQLYWRGQTYAGYTGRGWEDAADAEVARFDAGEPWIVDANGPPGARTLVTQVSVAEASLAVVYGPAEPVGVDRPYRALLRAPGDLIALSPVSGARNYTVLSRVMPPEPQALRAAGQDYPPEIARLYLQLPPEVEPALRDLAAEWTKGAAAPYDAAVTIEAALREIPYSLDLPKPPEDRDLVSWFLFDLRRGYCDYYASAMVVLARLSGIPARLAIGYATGEYDEASGRYVVTELNAHSWPELYFPGQGWVAFEPTGYQPLPDRPRDDLAAGEQAVQPSHMPGPEDYEAGLAKLKVAASNSAAADRQRTAGQAALASLNGLAAIWALWVIVTGRLRPVAAPGTASAAYDRLLVGVRGLGVRLKPGSTPREAAATIAGESRQIAERTRLGRAQARAAASEIGAEAARLAADVEAELYAPGRGVPPSPVRKRRLVSALRRLRLARALRL